MSAHDPDGIPEAPTLGTRRIRHQDYERNDPPGDAVDELRQSARPNRNAWGWTASDTHRADARDAERAAHMRCVRRRLDDGLTKAEKRAETERLMDEYEARGGRVPHYDAKRARICPMPETMAETRAHQGGHCGEPTQFRMVAYLDAHRPSGRKRRPRPGHVPSLSVSPATWASGVSIPPAELDRFTDFLLTEFVADDGTKAAGFIADAAAYFDSPPTKALEQHLRNDVAQWLTGRNRNDGGSSTGSWPFIAKNTKTRGIITGKKSRKPTRHKKPVGRSVSARHVHPMGAGTNHRAEVSGC
jgi:hypothetical protein